MKAQHTPGEWWIDDDGFIAAGHGDDYVTIAEVICDDARVDRDTNASFIVRACNAHDELLEALKYLDNAINEPSLNIDIIEASDKARAAIATAEGRGGGKI